MFWFYCFIVAISVFVMAVSGIWLAKYLLSLYQVQDEPNARSNHSIPVPRGAGIALMIPVIGFMMVTGAPHLLLWAALGVLVISFFDDLHSVPVRQRLIIQLAASLLAMVALEGLVFQGLLPGWLDYLLAVFLLLGFMNLYNFMDGIDGITGMQTIALGLGFLVLGIALDDASLYGLPADGVILISAALAFLFFNWHPARIFLGDSGSIPLGLINGFLLLQIAAAGYPVAAAILPAYYLLDGGLTFLLRLIRREKVWQAHSEHAYQQAVRAGWPHDRVVKWIAAFNLLAIILALVSVLQLLPWYVPLSLCYVSALALWWHFRQQSGTVANATTGEATAAGA